MGRYSFTVRRAIVTVVATFAASLAVTASGAQAIVVNDAGTEACVSLVPSVRGTALPAGADCEFGSLAGAGHDFPASGCTPSGSSFIAMGGIFDNSVCLTDPQIQGEVATMVTQAGILGRTQPGYSPLVTLLLPPGVDTC